MTDITKLVALLELDEDGEWFAGEFNKCLVDRRKRELLRLKLIELESDGLHINRDITLSQSEADVMQIVHDANRPLMASDITSRFRPDMVDSLRYRQHASATLNKLVDKGLLGKVPSQGRGTYFAPVRDAVKQILVHIGEVPESVDLSVISDISGLPMGKLADVIKELN